VSSRTILSVRRPPLSGSLWQRLLFISTALIVGKSVGQERWLYVIAITAIPFVLLWPVQVCLGTFAMLVPFDYIFTFGSESTGPGSTANWYVGAVTGIVLLATGFLGRRLRRPPPAALWWSLLMVWSGMSALWALDPWAPLRRLPTAFALLLLYLVAVSLWVSKEELSRISFLAVLGGVAAACYAFIQYRHGVGWAERATLVLDTRQTNPNHFAASLILPMSLAIGSFLSCRNRVGKVASMVAVAVIAFGLYLSMCRGALVALVVMMLVYLYRCRAGFRVFLVLAVLSTMLVAAPAVFFTRLNNSMPSRGEGRFDIWQVGLVAMRHHGILGAGLDNFPLAYEEYVGSASRFRGYNRASHNIFLETAVEVGIVGFVLFIGALQSQLRAALAFKTGMGGLSWPATAPYEAACWGMLAMGFSLDNLWHKTFWLSWILLAIAVRVAQQGKDLALSPCDGVAIV
jgi:O-antigen ligase